ncbi:MAG: hypothetical protein GY945_09795 [Rhodobacteraceae bacterium]|nr:hypothetical protein [Paracoccaceae bacterium]
MEEYDFNHGETAAWVSQEVDAYLKADDEKYAAEQELEAKLNAPIAEQFHTFGFKPDMLDETLLEGHYNEQVRIRDDLIKKDDEFGVLRRSLPVPGGTPCRQKKTAPYAIGHPTASVDRFTGKYALIADGNNARDTGKIGTVFQVKTGGTKLRANCTIFNHGVLGHAWGFFVFTHLRLDLHFFVFNMNSNKVFASTKNVYHYKNWWAGVVGLKQVSGFFKADVTGTAANGDRLVVAAVLTARVSAPAGGGKIDYSGELVNLCIDR